MAIPITSPARLLARALQTLATGLTLPSESDYPYKAFHAPLAEAIPLNAASFHTAAHLGRKNNKLYLISAAEFFKMNEEPDQNSPENILAYRRLQKVMQATLQNLIVIYARGDDVVEVPFFVFGRLPIGIEAGSLIGLKSIAVET